MSSEPMTDAVRETLKRLKRQRRRRTKLEQPVFKDGNAKAPQVLHHDVLVVAPKGVHADDELFRVPVVKKVQPVGATEQQESVVEGEYVDPPEKLDSYDYSGRRAIAVARPQDWGPSNLRTRARGPAFGTLPVKREPAATACAACYLIDAQHLNFRNAWTAEEWNDLGAPDLEPAAGADAESFELLVGGPRGQVFYLRVNVGNETDNFWKAEPPSENADQSLYELRRIDLKHESEIWNQLRNGCVVGSVVFLNGKDPTGNETPVPLLNVTSIKVKESEQ